MLLTAFSSLAKTEISSVFLIILLNWAFLGLILHNIKSKYSDPFVFVLCSCASGCGWMRGTYIPRLQIRRGHIL